MALSPRRHAATSTKNWNPLALLLHRRGVLAAQVASGLLRLIPRGLFALLVDLRRAPVILDGQFVAHLHVLIQRTFLNAYRYQLRYFDQGMVR